MTNGKIYTKNAKTHKKTKNEKHTKKRKKRKTHKKAKPLFLSTVKYSGDDETQVPLGVEGIRGNS